MIITRAFPSGAWRIRKEDSSGVFFTVTYYDYTRREAVAQFRADYAEHEAQYIREVRP